MAQLTVRKLDESIRERLRARARRHGRTLEEEARAILEQAAVGTPVRPASKVKARKPAKRPVGRKKGLGTLMHERFKKLGLTDAEWKRFNKGIEGLRRGDALDG
jgi:plasmid stability protein